MTYVPGAFPPPRTPGTIKDPVMTVVLFVVTCYFYGYYWIYKTSEEIQNFTGEHGTSPAMEIVLSIVTCGFYTIYWYWKYFSLIPRMQEEVGLPVSDNTVMLFILLFVPFGYFYSIWSVQNDLNAIYERAGAVRA